MKRYRIVPKREWVNLRTGQRASIFGASPYPEKDWEVKETGVSLHDAKENTYRSQHGDTVKSITERMDKFNPNWKEQEL